MKKYIAIVLTLILCATVLAGCSSTSQSGATPADAKDVTWTTYDYSLKFNVADDCKGTFTFGDTQYKIKASFEPGFVTITDLDKNKTLFEGIWQSKEENKLSIYGVTYNTKDYKEFKECYSEFFEMKADKNKK